MTAFVSMAFGRGSIWALVVVLAVVAALVAAVAAWRGARASRAAIAALIAQPADAISESVPATGPEQHDAPASNPSGPGPQQQVMHPVHTGTDQSSTVRHRLNERARQGRRPLDDPDPLVRAKALQDPDGELPPLDALIGALDDDYPIVRRQAVRSLRAAGGPLVTRALLDAANRDPSAEVREEAVGVLADMLREARSEQHAERGSRLA